MNRKIFLNKWHIIILALALIGWLLFVFIWSNCTEISSFECFLEGIFLPELWLIALDGLIILYLVITLISWLCYKKK